MALTKVPSGRTISILRNVPDVKGVFGSSRYFRATPIAILVSNHPAFTQVRACRELPLRSASNRLPRTTIFTLTRYASLSSTPSQSMPSSPSNCGGKTHVQTSLNVETRPRSMVRPYCPHCLKIPVRQVGNSLDHLLG